MDANERRFVAWISASHGVQHFLRRIFPPLIPIWVVGFDYSLSVAGLLLGAQSLGSALGQAPFGVLSDRHDRRLLLPAGIALAALSVVAFGVLPFSVPPEVEVLLAGAHFDLRLLAMLTAIFLVGVGGSVLHPTGYPLISANVDEGRKGRVLGIWGSAGKFGDGLAPAVVGALLLVAHWGEVLVLLGLLVLGYAVALYAALASYETRPPSSIPGVCEQIEGVDHDDGERQETGREYGSAAASQSFRVAFLLIFAFFALRMIAGGGVNVFIPQFVTTEYGYSFSLAGLDVTPESTASFYYSSLLIAAGLAQLWVGRLADRQDARKVVIGLLLVGAAGLVAMATMVLSALLLFGVLLVVGGSLWGIAPARDAIVSSVSPPDREGRTFGYLWTGAGIIDATSPVLVGFIGDVAGLRGAFWLLAATTILAIVPLALLSNPTISPSTGADVADSADD